ncbi:MAG: hypothetical protein KatS3mg077_1261 [Candidatus Binatia bacterium]|nr:MAG: hypothetical protein KatS3mg077_1261 [Candidatus Binatia bacterium]
MISTHWSTDTDNVEGKAGGEASAPWNLAAANGRNGSGAVAPKTVPGAHIREWPWAIVGVPALAILVALLYLCCLGRMPLLDPDEGRHAEIAREALQTGNWIAPTLNYQPYHHKPMPFYWLVAGGLSAFPAYPEVGARLPSALAAVCAVAATTWWTATFLGLPLGLLAGAVLATAVGFVVVGRAVLVDMSFTWWVIASHLFLGWLALRPRSVWWWVPWMCVGLAMLLKGPAALVLLGGSALLFSLTARHWTWLRTLRPARGVLLAAGIAATWYIVAAVVAPDYLREFWWRHNVERFVSGAPGHPHNALYYVYVLPAVFLPWSLWWPLVAVSIWPYLQQGDRPLVFCACWAASVVGFFTVSASKLPTYVLPAFPPLAILTARGLAALWAKTAVARWQTRWERVVLLTLTVTSVAVLILGWPVWHLIDEPEIGKASTAVAAAFSLILLPYSWWTRNRPSRASTAIAVASAFVAGYVAFYGVTGPFIGSRYSLATAADTLKLADAGANLYAFGAQFHSLLFYSGRPITSLSSAGDAASVLSKNEPSVLLTKRSNVADLACQVGQPLFVLWEGERDKVLVANRAGAPRAEKGQIETVVCSQVTAKSISGVASLMDQARK